MVDRFIFTCGNGNEGGATADVCAAAGGGVVGRGGDDVGGIEAIGLDWIGVADLIWPNLGPAKRFCVFYFGGGYFLEVRGKQTVSFRCL